MSYSINSKKDIPLIDWHREFKEKNNYLSQYYNEVTPTDFYKEVFPEDYIESRDGTGKPCPIILLTSYDKDGTPFRYNKTIFNDYEGFKDALDNDFALCSMCSYFGNRKTKKNASLCHGFCIDLDGVDVKRLNNLFNRIEVGLDPMPTYIANSGHGIHLYFVFEEPIPLYPKETQVLNDFKHKLTETCWNFETSLIPSKERQYQGIYQGFRMPGSKSKLAWDNKNKRFRKTKIYTIRVFEIGPKVDMTYLNDFIFIEDRLPQGFDDLASCSTLKTTPMNQAKELWPEWYDTRIVKKTPKGHYSCSEGLFNWWVNQISRIAREGNRYWCIAFLYVYGVKCGIDIDKINETAFNLLNELDSLSTSEDNLFTEEDIRSASEFYRPESCDCPLSFIEEKVGVKFERQRRNYRKQKDHLMLARLHRTAIGSYETVGRPDKQALIQEWKVRNPGKRKIDCEKELGLSRHTVLKWW